jgi:hypothetical protein
MRDVCILPFLNLIPHRFQLSVVKRDDTISPNFDASAMRWLESKNYFVITKL